jgi:membrane fusion protein (multidrug efflux system)
MSTAFSRTVRTLHADGFRPSLVGVGAVLLLLGSWAAWSLLARVTLYEVSANARLEIDRAAYAIQAPLSGHVSSVQLAIGRQVKAGDVLLELDSAPQQFDLGEERARAAAMEAESTALQRQMAAEEQAQTDEQQTARVATDVARADAREAGVLSEQAAREAARLEKLKQAGLISDRDYEAGQSEARRRSAGAETHSVEVHRLDDDRLAKQSERVTRIRRAAADISRLEGQQAVARATIARLAYEIERRKVRAPIDGRIGEAAIVRAGGVLAEGDKLGAIVPDGRLLVVAQFPPPAALGRLRPGQRARMRLAGFPWMQYGAVAATVARVSSEVRDGTVRAELILDASQKTPIPLQHGLPGSVEVEVEKIAPARLVLRVAGQWIAEPR